MQGKIDYWEIEAAIAFEEAYIDTFGDAPTNGTQNTVYFGEIDNVLKSNDILNQNSGQKITDSNEMKKILENNGWKVIKTPTVEDVSKLDESKIISTTSANSKMFESKEVLTKKDLANILTLNAVNGKEFKEEQISDSVLRSFNSQWKNIYSKNKNFDPFGLDMEMNDNDVFDDFMELVIKTANLDPKLSLFESVEYNKETIKKNRSKFKRKVGLNEGVKKSKFKSSDLGEVNIEFDSDKKELTIKFSEERSELKLAYDEVLAIYAHI